MSLIGKTRINSTFRVLREVSIPELSIEAVEFEHQKTGAKAFHLQHSSPAAFSIAFRTLPDDSTGLPHILEHTALCGSKKYPVRDPFFKMLDRSLAVYMNAWTGSDFTQYPFVSANEQDYQNLRSIYLDAVFNPLLQRDDFLQEGWRLERNEKTGQIEVGGVVYNEMKGALSDADSLFLTRLQQARFPGESVYSVVSGGDPVEIPKLKHEDLVAFHSKFYHPSNAVSVSTGNSDFDWKENLKTLNEAFYPFERTSIDTNRLFLRPKLAESKVTCFGPPDPLGDPQKQVRMICSHLTNPSSDLDESFAMKIMSDLLFDGPASPFYQALIDSGLGSEYASGTGYDNSTSHATLAVGLQGISEDSIQTVESTIYETFRKVRADTARYLSRERIDSMLHQLQLSLRYTPANFGLNLVAGITQSWVHGADPLASLSIDKKVQTFLMRYERGGVFEELLDKYVLGPEVEPHLLFVMKPDTLHNAKLKEAEAVFLQSPNLNQIEANSKRLREKQLNSGDLTLLPCLKLSDIPLQLKHPAILPISNGTFFHNCTPESNGLVHFKALLPLPLEQLCEREIKLIPLLLQSISELGSRERGSAAEFDCAVRASTGGLSFACEEGFVQAPNAASLSLLVSSFALKENSSKMFALLKEALTEPNLLGDLERLKTVLMATSASFNNSIASAGNRFAALRASSLFSSRDALLSEWMSGMSQAEFLDSLLNVKIDFLAEELEKLRIKLLSQSAMMRTLLVSNDSDFTRVNHFIERMKQPAIIEQDLTNPYQTAEAGEHQFVPGPFNSSFAALSLQLPLQPSPSLQASLVLTARLLRSKFLHREVRERGGAYGSAASYSPLTSRFCFTSFRDPQPIRSLEIFRASLEALLPGKGDAPSEQDLLGAKLAVFSDLDAPVQLASRGLGVFRFGGEWGSDERRMRVREALRSCTLADINNCIETILKPVPQRTCIIGTQ